MRRRISIIAVAAAAAAVPVALAGGGGAAGAATSGPTTLPKQPVAYGTGGGAATMSPYATASAIRVLKHGGNAVDAAVAAAATLGVTEPFVAGPGGGGFFVYRRHRDGKSFTIDGREKAPAGATPGMFLNAKGKPEPFEKAVESGESIGVPGQVATWGVALQRFGTRRLSQVLRPAERIARRGFPLDDPLVASIRENRSKLAHFPAAKALYLPGGKVPKRGYVLHNADLANTYAQIGRHGWRWFYTGPIASEIAALVQHPQTSPGTKPVAPGTMTAADMRHYTAPVGRPVSWRYRGYRILGMRPPSSGGTTMGETMSILSNFDQGGDRDTALFRYLEASKLAYADRGEYAGDGRQVKVPVKGMVSKAFGRLRARRIGRHALKTPVKPADPWKYQRGRKPKAYRVAGGSVEQHTNHLVVTDRKGNVVSYTNTIEQIAGSGMLLPGRGFLLNNELTDFNFPKGTANSVAPDKRPRSSMSPTIVLRGGHVVEAIGSPGGATIITTVLQTLLDQIDFGMSLPQAIEEPRASQENGPETIAEPAFIDEYGKALKARGERFTKMPYIGIVAGLVFLPHHTLETATEAWRGGGGSAMVVHPRTPVPPAAR